LAKTDEKRRVKTKKNSLRVYFPGEGFRGELQKEEGNICRDWEFCYPAGERKEFMRS